MTDYGKQVTKLAAALVAEIHKTDIDNNFVDAAALGQVVAVTILVLSRHPSTKEFHGSRRPEEHFMEVFCTAFQEVIEDNPEGDNVNLGFMWVRKSKA